MADSIKRFGLIHPIVVTPDPSNSSKFILVAGERRYRGAVLAGLSEVQASLREGASSLMAEIELEENVCRANIDFEEEGIILRKITERKKAEDPSWKLEDTAEMTGRSVGDVSSKIKIAKKFQERPELKKACADGKMPYTATLKKIDQIEEAEKVQRLADQGQIQLTTDLQHGDCRKLIARLKPASVDLLLTDPPYGLEKLEALREAGSAKLSGHQLMSEMHNLNIEKVLELLQDLAPEFHRVLKPGAHFYMFSGFQHIGRFIDALDPHLEFQPPIVIWDRGKPSSPGYGYNYLSRVEAIIYGCRPPKGRRLTESMYNVIECPDVPKPLRMYPTEKPTPLLQTLIKQSTSPNGLVLDPFAGSGSTLAAAREVGRRGIGFEINEESFLRAQKRLQEPVNV
jgi:site-specific DNA-methyltransferase (adenine-specific)